MGILERYIESIQKLCEAVNRIIKEEPDISISVSRRIIDTRNKIIHRYGTVSEEII